MSPVDAVAAAILAEPSVDAYVWLSPGRYSGEPCIGGHSISTRQIADSVWYGHADDLERGYDLTREDIIVACWFEARHGRSRKIRRAWREWLDTHDGTLWHLRPHEWAAMPLPPVMDQT